MVLHYAAKRKVFTHMLLQYLSQCEVKQNKSLLAREIIFALCLCLHTIWVAFT